MKVNEKLSILLILEKSKASKDGKMPITIRLTIDSKEQSYPWVKTYYPIYSLLFTLSCVNKKAALKKSLVKAGMSQLFHNFNRVGRENSLRIR